MPSRLQQVVLPDRTRFWCLRPGEVRVIHDSVREYFQHGICVNDDDIVFDVGANIGLFAHEILKLGRRNVSIFSFEPIPAVFAALSENVRASGVKEWTAWQYGLGRDAETVAFGYLPRASMLSTAYPDDSSSGRRIWRDTVRLNLHRFPWSIRWVGWLPGFLRDRLLDLGIRRALKTRQVQCRIRTLSEVVREHSLPRIDLLKIDVERGEMDVLAGIEAGDWPKIRQVAIEVHDLNCGRVAAVRELLSEHGFDAITVEQEKMLANTDIFNIYGRRGDACARTRAA